MMKGITVKSLLGVFVLILFIKWKALGVIPKDNRSVDTSSIFIFNKPSWYIWNADDTTFDPYQPISRKQKTIYSEYLIAAMKTPFFDFSMIFFDPKVKEPTPNLTLSEDERKNISNAFHQLQNLDKEYYWAFINATGTAPSMTVLNSTFEIESDFFTPDSDFIKYRIHQNRKNSYGDMTVPPYDLLLEIPANTRAYFEFRIAIEQFSWGFLRWKLSYDELVTWENITKDNALSGPGKPEPAQFEVLKNPCIPDLFAFVIITRSPINNINRVYTIVPLVNQTHWANLTSSFCTHYENHSEECGSVTQVLLTNNHILALSNLGLHVSGPLNVTVEQLSIQPEVLPVPQFDLIDPCFLMRDSLNCFNRQSGGPQTDVELKMHYIPVCHEYQRPNYRDIVVLSIFHGVEDDGKGNTSTNKALTILYASAPYTTWEILVKSIKRYLTFPLHNLVGIFYHHQLNHFDMVIGFEAEGVGFPHFDRVILRTPDTPDEVHDEIRFENEAKFSKVYEFPRKFIVTSIEVNPGSMDVFFMGNQLFIAESGGQYVYNALSNFAAEDNLAYCSFNHPDRTFLCVNEGHTVLLVGFVGTNYGFRETYPSEIEEIRQIAEEELWIAPYPENLMPNDTTMRGVFDKMNAPRFAEAFRHVRFTVSYRGTIQMWYMEGLDLKVKNKRRTLPGIRRKGVFANDSALESMHADAVKYKPKPNQLGLCNINPKNVPFVPVLYHGPLVPFIIDAVTVVLFEAYVEGKDDTFRYVSQVNNGNNIRCWNKDSKVDVDGNPVDQYNCELYIRHVKNLQERLPGFRSAIYALVEESIPMVLFDCDYSLKIMAGENLVNFTQGVGGNGTSEGCSCWSTDLVGQTIYIPGMFSILITNTSSGNEACAQGRAIRRANAEESYNISSDESYLIDMSTFELKSKANKSAQTGDPAWVVEGGPCIFYLDLIVNDLLRSSGGHVILDLQDSISFEVQLRAANPKAQLNFERPLIVLSNSNNKLIHVSSEFGKFERHQSLQIGVRPTGFGIGITSLIIRSLVCSTECATTCSITFIIQVMHREGRALKIEYPVNVTQSTVRLPDGTYKYTDENTGVGQINATVNPLDYYVKLPVNYRPPSARGLDIPLAANVYNVYPDIDTGKDYYRVSKETGVLKKCKNQPNRDACNCSAEDRFNDDPMFSDCKEMAYKVRRAKEIVLRITYPQVMDPARQNFKFFLARQNLTVWVEEINGRTEYSIKSADDGYLKSINEDRDLNLGHRFYTARNLTITCYGTGLFHFQAFLGDFDSFGDVSGYFMLYSEDFGITDVTYMIVLFLSLSCCFLLLFCGFLRVRRRLVTHLPIQGDIDNLSGE